MHSAISPMIMAPAFYGSQINLSYAHLRLGITSDLAISSSTETDITWSEEIASTDWSWSASATTATVPENISLVIASFNLFPNSGSGGDTAVRLYVGSTVWAYRSNDNQNWLNQNNRVFLPVTGGDDIKMSIWVNSAFSLEADTARSFLDLQGYSA